MLYSSLLSSRSLNLRHSYLVAIPPPLLQRIASAMTFGQITSDYSNSKLKQAERATILFIGG